MLGSVSLWHPMYVPSTYCDDTNLNLLSLHYYFHTLSLVLHVRLVLVGLNTLFQWKSCITACNITQLLLLSCHGCGKWLTSLFVHGNSLQFYSASRSTFCTNVCKCLLSLCASCFYQSRNNKLLRKTNFRNMHNWTHNAEHYMLVAGREQIHIVWTGSATYLMIADQCSALHPQYIGIYIFPIQGFCPPPLHLTTSKVMVIVWRLWGSIILTVLLYIGNVLLLQWAQLTITDHTARLGREFVFMFFCRNKLKLAPFEFCAPYPLLRVRSWPMESVLLNQCLLRWIVWTHFTALYSL